MMMDDAVCKYILDFLYDGETMISISMAPSRVYRKSMLGLFGDTHRYRQRSWTYHGILNHLTDMTYFIHLVWFWFWGICCLDMAVCGWMVMDDAGSKYFLDFLDNGEATISISMTPSRVCRESTQGLFGDTRRYRYDAVGCSR